MVLNNAHVLIHGTREYVILHGKEDFVIVIKLMIVKWGDYPGLFGWTQYNYKGRCK